MVIDYEKIARAVKHYEHRGYKHIDVPWLVGKEAIDVTKPWGAEYFETAFGHLVGSGEQSFLQIRDQLWHNAKYQCVTPCFRDEREDEIHRRWFLKVELIETLVDREPGEVLAKMVRDADDFFGMYAPGYRTRIVDTPDGMDIEVNGVEVGSYGVREHDRFRWVYGTGVAEPRLSQALAVGC